MPDHDDAEFGPISNQLGYQLRRLDLLSMTNLFESLSTLSLTPARATAIAYVALHPACDQSALARALGINRASCMATVNMLVALGAVERRPGRDRRSNALYLTEAGRQLHHDFERIMVEADEAIFGVLDADERQTLDRLIRKTRALNTPGQTRIEPSNRAILRRVK